MANLRKRITGVDEIMDDLALPANELDPVLKGLGDLNAWFGGHKALIKALNQFPVAANNHISDWGCGGGDALQAIAAWASKKTLAFAVNRSRRRACCYRLCTPGNGCI